MNGKKDTNLKNNKERTQYIGLTQKRKILEKFKLPRYSLNISDLLSLKVNSLGIPDLYWTLPFVHLPLSFSFPAIDLSFA